MQEIEIINETPLTLSEIKAKLEKTKKDDLGFRATKAMEYLKVFGKEKKEKVNELKKKIEDLNIQRLKDRQIIKLIDLKPKDEDSVKSILSTDNITLKQEDIKRIVDTIK